MSYVPQLHQITPENEMIFPLLWYCQREKGLQAGSSAFDILWVRIRDLPYNRRLRAEGMRRAGTNSQGHSGQRGAEEGQRSRGLRDEIRGNRQRGHGSRAADAPQRPQRPRKPYPHPTRLHPTPSLADILLSCDRPVSKIICKKQNGGSVSKIFCV